ncbi:hypothetical protein ACFU5O_01575 [Streptomyces sp. NPDC057445]|uniref:hypothetical protein n=1 Tax=Streptomyces sp. NPDC057445 TaxID=3346136 RepID=UPI0036B1E25F
MTIDLQPDASAGSLVRIESRSKMPFNVFGSGKNQRNLEVVVRALTDPWAPRAAHTRGE